MTLYEMLVFLGLLIVLAMGSVTQVRQTLSRQQLFLETVMLGSHLQSERLRSAWTDSDFVVIPVSDVSLAYRARNRLEKYPSFDTGKIGFTESGTAKYSGTLRLHKHDFETRITLGVGLSPMRIYAVGL
jgi:hypothetical protein